MTAIPAGQDVTGTKQLDAWRERVMPPVEELAGDLWSIPVPIPDNPLRYVNSYAFAAGRGPGGAGPRRPPPGPPPNTPLRYVTSSAFAAGGGLVLLDTGWPADTA